MLDFHAIGASYRAWQAFCLIALLISTQSSAAGIETASNTLNRASNSIYFIALPYLCDFHYNQHNQAIMLRHDKNGHDLSTHQWVVSTTSIPEFNNHHGRLHVLDPGQHSDYTLSADLHHIIIPIHNKASLLLPLQRNNSASSPLWLQYIKQGQIAWHTPRLTPAVAAQIIAEKKSNARQAERLSKRMADRAFYFGYDTNDDALK